jgi:hypothetical protein
LEWKTSAAIGILAGAHVNKDMPPMQLCGWLEQDVGVLETAARRLQVVP